MKSTKIQKIAIGEVQRLVLEKKIAQNKFSAALELKDFNTIESAKKHIIELNEIDNSHPLKRYLLYTCQNCKGY